jgi:hypothetical protein
MKKKSKWFPRVRFTLNGETYRMGRWLAAGHETQPDGSVLPTTTVIDDLTGEQKVVMSELVVWVDPEEYGYRPS